MGYTQADAARRLGMTQPRLNDLLRGRFNVDNIAISYPEISAVDMMKSAFSELV